MKTYGITINEDGIERCEKFTTPFGISNALMVVCVNEHLRITQITDIIEIEG